MAKPRKNLIGINSQYHPWPWATLSRTVTMAHFAMAVIRYGDRPESVCGDCGASPLDLCQLGRILWFIGLHVYQPNSWNWKIQTKVSKSSNYTILSKLCLHEDIWFGNSKVIIQDSYILTLKYVIVEEKVQKIETEFHLFILYGDSMRKPVGLLSRTKIPTAGHTFSTWLSNFGGVHAPF